MWTCGHHYLRGDELILISEPHPTSRPLSRLHGYESVVERWWTGGGGVVEDVDTAHSGSDSRSTASS